MKGPAEAIRGAWGKLDKDKQDGSVREWHPLIDHCADVAAVLESLIALPVFIDRLERLAGRPLDNRDRARLAVHAFLHDLGKANAGFQAKKWPAGDARSIRLAGHVREIAGLFDSTCIAQTRQALPLGRLDTWGDASTALLLGSLSHHGRPLTDNELSQSAARVHLWRSRDGYDPFITLAELGRFAMKAWPEAFEDGVPIPDAPAFSHCYAGLVSLADWLGSHRYWFEYSSEAGLPRLEWARHKARRALEAMGLDVRRHRAAGTPRKERFEDLFDFAPTAAQKAMGRIDLGPLVILEAETGSGKTEAALWRFKTLFEADVVDSLYFALPTRTAALQIHARVNGFAQKLFGQSPPEAVLAVPGYIRAGMADATLLPGFEVLWADEPDAAAVDSRWSAERPKRFLCAQIAVGTVDQALMSALQLPHAHLRHASLVRSLLVIDEVHASDSYMASLLEKLLDAHLNAGGHALLMSATLGDTLRHKLLHAIGDKTPSLAESVATPYPAISSRVGIEHVASNSKIKNVQIERASIINEPINIAIRAIEVASQGAHVLIVRNTVNAAIQTQKAIEANESHKDLLFRVGTVVALHHGRFMRADRKVLDQAIEQAFGRNRKSGGLIAVGTQTLEQSLDIDADFLLTDLCPMDVLLQRIGRLHRHEHHRRPAGFEAPQSVVFVPEQRDLSDLIKRPIHGLGAFNDEDGIYDDVRVLEATWRLLEGNRELRLPKMNRSLVEQATHWESLEKIALSLGWEKHAVSREGIEAAAQGIADLHGLRFWHAFGEDAFPANDEAVRTRLGANDLQIALPEPLRTPFGELGSELRIPGFWAKEITSKCAETTERDANGWTIAIDGKNFRYDRFGLARA